MPSSPPQISPKLIISILILTSLHLSTSSAPLKSCNSKVILAGNSTILSDNGTFALGFFNTNDESKWYLGIWYASIPTPTYVWVANRQTPVTSRDTASFEVSDAGKLTVRDGRDPSRCDDVVWESDLVNSDGGDVEVKLLEDGNLVVVDVNGHGHGGVVWRSFDFPADTFLPGMNLTVGQTLTCWKTGNDPAPGRYSLRLRPPDYGEVELLFDGGRSYWTSGNWTGSFFSGVPQMTIPYIYKFHFTNPFTETATFGYTETTSPMSVQQRPLTRFSVDSRGQIRQFTWSTQTEFWNMFWMEPENPCRVYGLCGDLGFCNGRLTVVQCRCLAGFQPVDAAGWDAEDFSGGCQRDGGDGCGKNDGFREIGEVTFDNERVETLSGGGKTDCERRCLGNCSCVGVSYDPKTNSCKNFFGRVLNLGNSSSDLGVIRDSLSVRVSGKKNGPKTKTMILMIVIVGFVMVLLVAVLGVLILRRNRNRRRKREEESVFPVTNLKVFTYKELYAATNGFSDEVGHGGFGAVFSGEVDSTPVAVKRLERPGGGEKEFRAEVCTIGNIQHVNLVRLRGFCSEDLHRLLVYDYMPNGPLSVYLKSGGGGRNLDWDARFRIAIGTARGIAYLHEECRNCIIHCDIKPENILLDHDFSAKVSDFGLAKLIGRDFSRVLATMRGTWGYVAPEWISGVAITTKADVYSYGMTLLELLGGRRNVEGRPPDGGGGGESDEKWFFPPWAAKRITEGEVAAVVDGRLAGEYDVEEVERVGRVAVWCIQDEEAVRPTMGMVVKMLEGVVEVAVPPPPKLLQALVSGESFRGVGGNSNLYDTISRVSGDSKDSSIPV